LTGSIDVSEHGLPARRDVDVLDSDLLLTLAPMFIERLYLPRVDCQKFNAVF
jgi:hypothetical protein